MDDRRMKIYPELGEYCHRWTCSCSKPARAGQRAGDLVGCVRTLLVLGNPIIQASCQFRLPVAIHAPRSRARVAPVLLGERGGGILGRRGS